MNRTLIDFVRKVLRRICTPSYFKSFSQCGEDMILRCFLPPPPPETPNQLSWIDIGAYHPKRLNNTAFFYSQGRRGINIEANPLLIRRFYKDRKRDINLNIAIAEKSGTMDFFIMDIATLSTLSAEEAHRYEKLGHKIVKIVPIQAMTVTEVIDNFSGGVFPDLLSLDAEGYDLNILKTINYEKNSPKVICVENVPYQTKLNNYFDRMQTNDLSNFLIHKNYSILACTLINTIFIKNNFIEKGTLQ